ncbi:MAG TPA: M28 family peptidase [Verrucomicrobiae bacterium]|nr:M28 family peptidase [Verrucomicrobiae bacterium]
MNRFKTFFLTALFGAAISLSSVSYAGEAAAVLPPVPPTVDSITSTELRMHLEFLASDELGGRYTLAPNFAISARYLASRLKAYGFHGGGDHGDFLQTFEVIASTPEVTGSTLSITLGGQSTSYSFGDFYPSSGVSGEASGQIVFVGAGISSRSQNHDDYAGLDVKGKIVLIAPGAPAGVDLSRLAENESGEEAARAHGAAGVLQIPPQRFAEFMKNKTFRDRAAGRESVQLARAADGKLPSATLGPELTDKLLAALGLDLKAVYEAAKKKEALKPKAMDATAHLVSAFRQARVTTQNVVGIMDGADPQLRNQYVAFSAHYDHLKTGDHGEIYHGADDDGSGTTAILTIAHAISLDPPKRSVMIIFHAGEELGLLGSEYNTDFAPAVPLDKIVVDLNIDMIGRSKPPGDDAKEDEHLTDAHTIYLVGTNRISPELHKISESTNAEFQKLKLDYHYNDPNDPERIYYRSDHWNYAKHGIPIIFYFDGVHVDYHKPTDTVDKIDFTKLTAVTRLVFETGWRVANMDHRLSIGGN